MGSQRASSLMKYTTRKIPPDRQGQPSPRAWGYACPRHRARGCQALAQLHPAYMIPSACSQILFSKTKIIIGAFSSSVLLGWVPSVCCLSPRSSLLPRGWRRAVPVGTCGTGQKGLDMQDMVLPARSSASDPKQWEKFSQGFVLTEDSVSHAAPATVALSLSSLLSTSSCAEITSTKHVGVLPLPHFVFPVE